MSKEQITQAQIDAILDEAYELVSSGPTSDTAKAHKIATHALSLSGFKQLWPKVRGYVLSAISILQLFHRGDAAAGLAQFVAFVDLIVGGQLPLS